MSEDYGYYYRSKDRKYYYDVYGGDMIYYEVYQDGHESDESKYVEFREKMTFDEFKLTCEQIEKDRI